MRFVITTEDAFWLVLFGLILLGWILCGIAKAISWVGEKILRTGTKEGRTEDEAGRNT